MDTKVGLAVHLIGAVLASGLFLLYPHIARPGLLFGVYVGEQAWEDEAARDLQRAYRRRAGVAIAVGLTAGLLAAALCHWHPAVLSAVALLPIAGCVGAYVWAHRRARTLAAGGTPPAVASLEPTPPSGHLLGLATLAICTATGLAVVAWAWSRYAELPERIPTHFGITGAPNAWRAKSPLMAMLLPLVTLVAGVGLGGLTWATAGAKRALRTGDHGVSLRAQHAFRSAVTRYMSGVALIAVAMLAWMSVGAMRVGLGQARGLPPAGLVLTGVLVVYAMGGAIYLSLRCGQGGSRLERRAAKAPLTDGLADNQHWILGAFYVNRDDPSWMVEARFGFGYTVNLGNRKAVAALTGFLGLLLGLPIAALL